MSFEDQVEGLNTSCLDTFGQEFTYKPKLSASYSITGIIETGVVLEEADPAEGSTYAKLWAQSDSFSAAPVKGDTVKSGDLIYFVVRVERDAGSGVWLLLRYAREAL